MGIEHWVFLLWPVSLNPISMFPLETKQRFYEGKLEKRQVDGIVYLGYGVLLGNFVEIPREFLCVIIIPTN